MLPRYSFAHCHHRIALHQTGWAGNFSCHWHLYFSHGFPVPFPHPPQRSTPAPPGAATLFQLCHQLLHVVFDALILSQNCIPCYYTVQLALPVFAAAANPKIFPRTVGGPAMQAPTSKGQGLRKNISLFCDSIVGASIARPLRPCAAARLFGWSRAPPLQ